MSELKTTSLYDFHLSKNAKMIDFAGWSMPFSYDGTLKEHHYVRNSAGYFDVSHMGRLRLSYSQIEDINYLICSELKNLENTKALYSIFTSEQGTAIDDVIFWKFEDDLILICNASNTNKIKSHLDINSITYEDLTLTTDLIAIQGKNAMNIIDQIMTIPDKFSTFKENNYIYARTGYTGEDGVEVMLDSKDTLDFINMLETKGVKPCGLGSRDTLRLEASLPLYGFELTDDITPVEAGLKWTITNENDYLGKQIIDEQISSKQHKHLKRFKLSAKQIARTGTICVSDGVEGVVTSGNISPILGHPIGYVLFKSNPADDLVEFDIRGNLIEGNLIYKRFLS
jgi:aminomethyltransferase